MKLNSIRNRCGTARGFSLLELLVTLVVLSIGLLGLGLMQTTGLGLTKTAYARTQAMMLASDIADRIRANEGAAANYVGNSAATASTVPPICTAGATCVGPALAASDMTDWSNRLLLELPGGTGQILDAAAAPAACQGYPATAVGVGFMRVLIKWNEANSGTISENRTGGNANGDCYQFDFVF
jgi:type IV pilus assembly protein PilV